jgi:hypothetical protein
MGYRVSDKTGYFCTITWQQNYLNREFELCFRMVFKISKSSTSRMGVWLKYYRYVSQRKRRSQRRTKRQRTWGRCSVRGIRSANTEEMNEQQGGTSDLAQAA